MSEHKLAADAAAKPEIFDALLQAANDPRGAKFAWCNDAKYTAMAALGIVEMGAVVTRGWYRVPAGQCLRPDLPGDPRRLYSYAVAVDAEAAPSGAARRRSPGAAAWRCAHATAVRAK